ncbi:MAG: gliding motility-associated C-terminal domain-containing protein, partial [Chitinophagaceae bacterium]
PSECEGTAAVITADPGVSGNYSYNWTVPPGVNNPGSVASFSATVTGSYSVVVTNTSTGCNSISTLGNVTIIPIVKPQFLPVPPVCSGSIINPLPTVSLNNVNGTWTPAINNLTTTLYTFTPLGTICTDTSSMIIRVNNIPVISLGIDPDICPGQKIVLNPNATGFALNYQWQDGSTDPFYIATTKGDYSVIVSNQCGSTSGNVTIKQGICKVNIPSGFSPNNDGLNDHFSITGALYVIEFSMQVYNRWGQKVFETKNASPGWDGNFSGNKQPAGVYVYRISFTYLLTGEKNETSGTFILLR